MFRKIETSSRYPGKVKELKRRRSEVVTDPSYLEGISERAIDDLKTMRDECRAVESDVSFERRLCQGRIDILSAELDHRAGRAGDVISRLPEILAAEMSASDLPLPARATDRSVPSSAGVQRRRVEEIAGEQTLARLGEMDDDEVKKIIDSLADYEKSLSQLRRKIHEVVDGIQAEIVARYTSGRADPDTILGK